jgi:predicted acetyltransferase
MAVSIRDARQSGEDRRWIERAYREYLDDIAAGGTGVFPALLVTGQASEDLLGPWFHDERSMPFLILRSGEPAGFALVQRASAVRDGPQAEHRMTEFFVSPPLRRLGLGREAAQLLFNRFEGRWLVTESTTHAGAVAFWRRVIGAYTRGRYRERLSGGEVQHRFESARRSAVQP